MVPGRIHELLERHRIALEARGWSLGVVGTPIVSAAEVATALGDAGFGPRPEVLEYFVWRSSISGDCRAFWETEEILSVDAALAGTLLLREIRLDVFEATGEDRTGKRFELAAPGPDFLLSIAARDDVSLAVDTRAGEVGGAVWVVDVEAPAFPLFRTLAEAISLATYCILAGHWQVEPGRGIWAQSHGFPTPEQWTC